MTASDARDFDHPSSTTAPGPFRPTPRGLRYALAYSAVSMLDAERAHDLTLAALERPALRRWLPTAGPEAVAPISCCGLAFPNRVGLAAGLDKNGDHIDALGALGFGALEVGTVTPKPQSGNPRPRLFRLPTQQALINRMGFNNKGVEHLAQRLESRRYRGVVGVNIGKNAATSLDAAARDYVRCLERVHALADYVTLNLSSPNTPDLRRLQYGDALRELLGQVRDAAERLGGAGRANPPLLLKLAPDIAEADLDDLCECIRTFGIRGVIATNTTITRDGVTQHRYADEAGGLSGRPVAAIARRMLVALRERLPDSVALIAAGGIDSGAEAARRCDLGADLVQLYTGFVYRGPALIRDALRALR